MINMTALTLWRLLAQTSVVDQNRLAVEKNWRQLKIAPNLNLNCLIILNIIYTYPQGEVKRCFSVRDVEKEILVPLGIEGLVDNFGLLLQALVFNLNVGILN